MTNLELYTLIKSKSGGGGGGSSPAPAGIPYGNYTTNVELNGLSVLPDNAFNGLYNLKSIKLNNGLIEIGNFAFYGCTSLLEIDVPNSVTSIGEKAIGYNSDGELIDGFVLYGQYGTAAEEYALNNNIAFADKNATFKYRLRSEDNTAAILSYSGSSRKVIIPQYLEGHRVRRILADTFYLTQIYHLNARGIYDFVEAGTGSKLPNTLEFLYLSNILNNIAGSRRTTFLSLCNKLSTIVLEQDFDFPLICPNCPLTHDCLVSMLLSLKDRSDLTAQTLTVGSTNLAKLSNEEKAIATQKNWTLA